MCLRAIKTKRYSCSVHLSSVSWAITLTYTLNRLSSFQNLRRKGGKFDHRPERPKVMLRHCRRSTAVVYRSGRKALSTARVRRAGLLTTADTCLP